MGPVGDFYDEKNDGKQRISFNKPYDNPYAVLAWHLVAMLPLKSLKELLCSDTFIKRMVVEEAKQVDISGPFLDCIDEDIQKRWRLRGRNSQLKQLGEYYFSELNLEKVREEVRKYASELGIILE